MPTIEMIMPDFDAIIEWAERLRAGFPLEEVAEAVAVEIWQQNMADRLAGVDKDGEQLEPIKPATVERRRRRGDGEGAPLDPNYSTSRVVTNFDYNLERLDPFTVAVNYGWKDMPWLQHHLDGTVPGTFGPRDIAGMTPDAKARAAATFAEKVQEALSGS